MLAAMHPYLTTLLVVRRDKQGERGLFLWIAIPRRTGDGRIQERFLNFGDQSGSSTRFRVLSIN